jgi:hypothetical protein
MSKISGVVHLLEWPDTLELTNRDTNMRVKHRGDHVLVLVLQNCTASGTWIPEAGKPVIVEFIQPGVDGTQEKE